MADDGNESSENKHADLAIMPEMMPVNVAEVSQAEYFDYLMQGLMSLAYLPADELIVEVAKCFFNTPYVAGTLEGSPETLKIDLGKTDCILFVEQCVAMTFLIKNASRNIPGNASMDTWADNVVKAEVPAFDDFAELICNMRYRDGKVDGYSSRLHYTSEWIRQNENAGLIKEITDELGGKPLEQKFSFMSEHTEAYVALKDNPDEAEKIRAIERRLGDIGRYFYIPASYIPYAVHKIKDGDLIFFTSKISGLDITHCAIAYVVFDKDTESKSLHFIHASSKAGKVIIEPKTLSEYTKTGIRVARLSF